MAIKKIQKNRMNDAGTFDVIHYETDASQVLMEDGTTAEAAIGGKESAGAAAQALADAKSYTDTKIAGIPTPDVSGQINTHNTDANAHSSLFGAKADLIDGKVPDSELPEDLVSAAGGGELTMAASIGDGPYVIEFTEDEEDSIPASLISYDGTSSGVTAADVQGAINDVASDITSHASDDSIHVTPEEKQEWTGKADKPATVKVTLSASGWDSTAKTQTVTVAGVLADETKQLITPTPAVASQSAYYAAGILCTGQTENSLTFTADTVPTEDLTVYVVIQEVIPPKVTLISFTIAGTSYQAEDGMTWGEWVESEYNTNGYQIDNQGDGNGLYIQLNSAHHVKTSDSVLVTSVNAVIDGGQYILARYKVYIEDSVQIV